MATPSNLYDYYSSIGQTLPSLSTRGGLYQQYGLGSSTAYTGSAQQNTSLLQKLLGGNTTSTSTPTTIAPPNVSSPVPTSTITSGSSLNIPPASPTNTGGSLVNAAKAGTYIAPPTTSSTPNIDAATTGVYPDTAAAIAGGYGQASSQVPSTANGAASATPNNQMGITGDYSLDPEYQTAERDYKLASTDYKNALSDLPSQYDLFTNALESTGATKDLAVLKDLNAQLAAATADYDNLSAEVETRGLKAGTPGVFFQGEQAAIQRQKAVIVGSLATRVAAAQGNYELSATLAAKTAELKFADAENKVKRALDFVNLNENNLTRAEKLATSKMKAQAEAQQALIAKEKENFKEALSLGITSKYVNRNGKFYRTSDGKEYDTEQQFFTDSGVKTFSEAYQKGLVTDITGQTIADQGIIAALRAKYYDAGINLNDTIEQAQEKLKKSQLYLKDTYIKPETDGFTDIQTFNATKELRKELTKNTSDARLVTQQAKLMNDTYARYARGEAKDLNATSQAIITAFGKLIDPGSVVREAEYARTGQGQALIENIAGRVEKLKQGGAGLTAQSLKEVVDLGQTLARSYQDYVDQQNQIITDNAKAFGLDPQLIIQGGGGTDTSDPVVEKMRSNGLSDDEIEQLLGRPIAFSSVGGVTDSASKIAAAIKKVESGGNYNARGGSGESGAYQFMPSTWKSWAKAYLGDANAPMTPSNQDRVAIAKINDLLSQGYNAKEIALIWNGGSPTVKAGTNKYGVKYDTLAYANKVLNALKG